MVDDIIGVFTLALIITAIGMVLKNGDAASKIISNTFAGFAKIQTAAQG